jgi:pentatricopeptide repeat protein
MRALSLVPSLPLWNKLLCDFNASGLVSQVKVMYSDMVFCGVVPDVFSVNVLVHSLCKVGDLDLALGYLRNNDVIDSVTYNTVIWGYCQKGLADQGFGLLSEMVKRGYVLIQSLVMY